MKIPVGDKEKRELLEMQKELFGISANVAYNISTSDPLANFDEISDQETYDPAYLDLQKAALRLDGSNPVVLNNLGNYYSFLGQNDSAVGYFQKAHEKMDIKYFRNDSAFYYSFRSVLRLNLGMDKAIDDMDRALVLNSKDSIARSFYPLFLINNREFKKASELCARILDEGSPTPVFHFVMLASAEVFGSGFPKLMEAMNDPKLKAKYRSMDYNQVSQFGLVDKYVEKFSSDKAIRNARYMADLLALAFKLGFFEDLDKPSVVFAYTPNDKTRLAELEKIFLDASMKKELNPYSLNKCLGFTYFLQQKRDKAIQFFNTAIQSFPAGKSWTYFSSSEMYDCIGAIHYLNKDTLKFREILLAKIKAEPDGKKNVTDYELLARHYYITNDLRKAEEWADKSVFIDPGSVDVNRLLAHIHYLKNNPTITEIYAQEAMKNARTAYDQGSLLLQFAIYQLINSDATNAYSNIDMAKKAMEQAGESCEMCDRLITTYITVSK